MMSLPSPQRTVLAAALLAVVFSAGLAGCKSKNEKALDQAKAQAVSTGQAQQVISTDANGNTVTTTVQPPQAGQKDQVITTTVTPKGSQPVAADGSAQPTGAAPAPNTASGPVVQPAPPPVPPEIHVAAGTELAIRIDHQISTKHSRAGDRFSGELVEPVVDGDTVVIPKGALVGGVVDVSKKRGHFKGAGNLALRLTSLTLNGQEYPLDTADMRARKKGKGKRTAAIIGGGTGLGMLIGGVATGGLGVAIGGAAGAGAGTAVAGLTGNRDLVIPAESIVRFKLADELVIQP